MLPDKFVMPGIIDCHSHIAADSINEGSVSVSSMVGIEDVLNPDDIAIYRALAGGVTTANILHGSANSIGGKCTVHQAALGQGRARHDLRRRDAGHQVRAGRESQARRKSHRPAHRRGAMCRPRYPATRMGVEDVIREAFTEAKAYQQAWKDYNEKVARGEQAVAPRRDLKLEPLVEVLEGKRLVHAHCYRADEILMLLRVADDFGFKIRTLQHVLEGYKVAKEIAAHGAGASTFSDWWAYKMEAFDAIPYNAAIMTRKGVLVSLNSDSDELMRHLNDEAAKTMKYGGLTETEALSLITINPAKQLMIDNRVGSIEVGKDADLAIFDKHPLSNYAKVEKVFIDGQLYFDREQRFGGAARARSGEEEADRQGKRRTEEECASRAAGGPQHEIASCLLSCSLFRWLAADEDSFLIRGATVHPVASAEIQNGSVLVRDGKIVGVGRNLAAPKGMRIIEGKGLHVYPGMIDSATEMGLSEIGSIRESVDVGEIGKFDPQLRAEIAINPASEHIPVTRANGITTVIALPMSAGGGGGFGRGGGGSIITGQAALVHLDGWTWEEMEIKKSAGMGMRFPIIPAIGWTLRRTSARDRRPHYFRRCEEEL